MSNDEVCKMNLKDLATAIHNFDSNSQLRQRVAALGGSAGVTAAAFRHYYIESVIPRAFAARVDPTARTDLSQ